MGKPRAADQLGDEEAELEAVDGDVITVMTEDEAIALALEMCPPGEFITIHAAECPVPEGDCDCEPLILRPGASA